MVWLVWHVLQASIASQLISVVLLSVGRVRRGRLKLLFLPGPLRVSGSDIKLRGEPSIVPLLRAGRIGDACEVAARRLYISGLSPLRARFPDAADGPRIAAALIFPVRSSTELMALALLQAAAMAAPAHMAAGMIQDRRTTLKFMRGLLHVTCSSPPRCATATARVSSATSPPARRR